MRTRMEIAGMILKKLSIVRILVIFLVKLA